jgi:hypothetical protein
MTVASGALDSDSLESKLMGHITMRVELHLISHVDDCPSVGA